MVNFVAEVSAPFPYAPTHRCRKASDLQRFAFPLILAVPRGAYRVRLLVYFWRFPERCGRRRIELYRLPATQFFYIHALRYIFGKGIRNRSSFRTRMLRLNGYRGNDLPGRLFSRRSPRIFSAISAGKSLNAVIAEDYAEKRRENSGNRKVGSQNYLLCEARAATRNSIFLSLLCASWQSMHCPLTSGTCCRKAVDS